MPSFCERQADLEVRPKRPIIPVFRYCRWSVPVVGTPDTPAGRTNAASVLAGGACQRLDCRPDAP